MADISDKLKNLSPEQLELLRKKLSAKGMSGATVESIPERTDKSVYHMTAAQKRLWFLQQLDSGSAFYSIPCAIRIVGLLNMEAMERAIQQVVNRHDVLRSFYTASPSGEPDQYVDPTLQLPLQLVDLTSYPEQNREEDTRRLLTEIALTPFNLTQPPLLSATLVKRQENDFVLMLNLHHIIADGWSVGILMNEIIAAYRGFDLSQPAFFHEPRVQFADYAAWLQNRITHQNLDRQLDYWKEYLQGMPPILEWKTDFPRPAIQSHRGKQLVFQIPRRIVEGLRRLSREHNTSLYNSLMAATQLFLHKYTQQKDFGIGAPIANRHRKDVEEIVGFFVNTVVLRAEFSKDVAFNELIERVKQSILSAAENQDVPFERIVESLMPQRDLSRSPLFQVMFDLQHTPIRSPNLDRLSIELYDIDIKVSKFDMLFLLMDDGEGLQGTLEYNTELFRDSTAEQCVAYFQTLLAHIIENPAKNISELCLVTPAQEQQILYDWNANKTDYPRDKTLQQLFEASVASHPGAVAAADPRESLTYLQLNERANRLAHYLSALGVAPGSFVAIYMERSVEMIAAMLAVIKTGACYVPLDLAYPAPRLTFMLKDTDTRVVLTDSSLADKLPADGFKVIALDQQRAVIEAQDTGNPPFLSEPLSPAYVIYTSGSTGRPKGVVVPHRAIVRLVINTNYVQLTPDDVFAQVSNAAFDAATFEIWGALLNAAKLVIIPKEVLLSSRLFVEQLREQRINTMFVTVAYFNQVVKEFPGAFKTLKYCMFGGEAADVASVRRVLLHEPPLFLFNAYGPTENTTFSTTYRAQQVDEQATNIPIGTPIANSTSYVLDDHQKICPPGVPGELYLGGDGLSLGYHNRPELNAERFVSNPLPTADDRLYRTGDLVRYLPDGNVEFFGRIDQQVKIRGFRIELGEIEFLLRQHHDLSDVVVLARENKLGEKQLTAYCVPVADAKLDGGLLRQFLAEKLPEYMIPAFFVEIAAIPLNANGKVDKRALPDPTLELSLNRNEYIAPRTALEAYLATMWQEILGVERVGVYDHFFEIGGNSLKAAVLANRLQNELQENIHVASVFKAPRIAEFALYAAEYYGTAVAERFGKEVVQKPTGSRFMDNTVGEKIGSKHVDEFRRIISPLAPFPQSSKTKNSRAIFVLSPPRTGSTLLRVMLAGNQKLFSPPELDLLSFNTLQERREAFSEEGLEIWLQAPIRAIMELQNLDAEAAAKVMNDCEARNLSVKDFYGQMQSLLEGRLLVDKTPTYPFEPSILARAEEDFADALYIHLVRHPYAMIYSFMEAKLDENFFRHPHPFTRRQLAELIWIVSNQNILDFFKSVPAERQYRLHFENVLSDPEGELRQLCDFMQIDFQKEMLEPYKGKKMTDGVNKYTQMVGDFKFYLHKTINTDVAERWRQYHSEDFLSDVAWELAQNLGYTPEKELAAQRGEQKREKPQEIVKQPRDGEMPLSFAQQRLWFLDQFEPGNPQYNVPIAAHLKGQLSKKMLEESLNHIVRRHETLRTTFEISSDGKARQVIHSPKPVRMPFVSLLDLPEQEREHEAHKIANVEAGRQFDLRLWPLIRARLIQTAEREFILVLVLHHIISDGWSANVLIREMAAAYEQLRQGREVVFTDLPVQYVDYAAWQRQWLAGGRLEEQLSYWKQKLSDLPAVLELPTDRPRAAASSHRGGEMIFRFPRELTQALQEAAKAHGVTEFMLLLAGFQVLLSRYANQSSIAVGTPIANRVRREIEPLIGFFVNTLVMRGDLAGNPTFTEYLAQVKKTAVEAYEHQDVPFEKLVDLLQPERDTSHTPLFQVMFALQESALESIELPELFLSVFQITSGAAKFDLSLSMVERDGQFRGQMEYDTDLFNRSTINRLLAHFERLLTVLVSHPAERILTVDFMPETEKNLMIREWNRTETQAGYFSTIVSAFEAQAVLSASQIAVSDHSRELTYAELNEQANRLAHVLHARGVGPETIVGICLPRTVESVIALLAVLKAGGTYVPLDPEYPRERLRFIFQDTKLQYVITLSSLTAQLPIESQTVVLMEKSRLLFAGISAENPMTPTDPGNMAYIIYTSGSTGQPKGVMISHRSALNLLLGLEKQIYSRLPKRPLRTSLNAPLLFDASVQQLLTLLSGHHLTILPAEVRMDGDTLLAYLAEKKVDVLDCVPSQLKLLIAAGLFDQPEWTPLALLPGGEAIDAETWRLLRDNKRTLVFNMYGPTECTVDTTAHPVNQLGEVPVIGRPLANARMYILDAHLRPVPIGVSGEICIAGAGLARGYLNRPELTAEKFVPDPFSEQPGRRMYRSGDLGRFLEDGVIEFLGRLDHQVKLRGFRMELGEIETVLKRHESIRECLVMVREDTPGEKRLAAYFTVCNSNKPSATELRDFLKKSLPEYMIPSLFAPLEKFPLTPNGKLDRKALPKPQMERNDADSAFADATTKAEKSLAVIWKQVLSVEAIGIDDNFFTLGGDSILSIQVLARARQQGLSFSPKDFFNHPTIRGLASIAGSVGSAEAEQGAVVGEASLSPIQRSFFAQNLVERNQWNQSLLLESDEPLDVSAMRSALSALFSHHDILRAIFINQDGEWRQSISASVDQLPLVVFDFETSNIEEQAAFIERAMAEQQAALDVTAGPICRFVCFNLQAQSAGRLGIIIHHLAVDGVSWRILLDDLQTAYDQARRGEAVSLSAKTTSYFHWAKTTAEKMPNEADLSPWLLFANTAGTTLPVDFKDGKNIEGSTRLVSVRLGGEETRILQQQAPQTFGVRFHEILLAAVANAVCRWSGNDWAAVDLEGHGRDAESGIDLSRTIGWFTTIFPVYLKSNAEAEIGDFIKTVKEQIAPFLKHSANYLPARYALQNNDLRQKLERAPHPQISFNYLGQFDAMLKDQRFRIATEKTGLERHPDNPRSYEFDVSARLLHGQLMMDIAYSSDRYHEATVAQIADHMNEFLMRVIRSCASQAVGEKNITAVGVSAEDVANVLEEMGLE